MKLTRRVEIPFFVLLFGASSVLRQFAILPANASCFAEGMFTGLGLLFVVVSLLPQAVYEKLPYRRWMEKWSS
jgi:hypothetical protein